MEKKQLFCYNIMEVDLLEENTTNIVVIIS